MSPFLARRESFDRVGSTNRTDVPLTKVPDYVRNAVLAAENRSFYTDPGISPFRLATSPSMFEITTEPASGSETPGNAVVMRGYDA